jgi:hypothetical protein
MERVYQSVAFTRRLNSLNDRLGEQREEVARTVVIKCSISEMMMKMDGIEGNLTRQRDMHSVFIFTDIRCLCVCIEEFGYV